MTLKNNFINMNKLITQLTKLTVACFVMLFGLIPNLVAQAPWCNAHNSYTYQMSSTNYVVAAEQIVISAGSNVVYNRKADGFNGTSTCGGEYSLANSTSNAFNLTAGNTYNIQSSSSSYYYGTTYNGKWGVYIDFNNDKDFIDAGEYLGTWNTTSGNNMPGSLNGINFTIP